MRFGFPAFALGLLLLAAPPLGAAEVQYYPVPEGDHPHDVALAPDGTVWYTAQHTGALGRLDPKTGNIERVPLGEESRPHGVIVGPDGGAWVTDSGLNAMVRVDPETKEVQSWPLPDSFPKSNLNTAAFDGKGRIWFTGQTGVYGVLDPKTGAMDVWDAPKGRGPYGIAATPDGEIYYVSLAGSYLGKVDLESGEVTVIEPNTPEAGLRRVWSDSKGRLWVSVYYPKTESWQSWRLPGEKPQAYSVYVDDADTVWLTDFGANAIVRFDPETERFESFPSDKQDAYVRQMLGVPGEAWGAESGTDRLVVVRTGAKEASN